MIPYRPSLAPIGKLSVELLDEILLYLVEPMEDLEDCPSELAREDRPFEPIREDYPFEMVRDIFCTNKHQLPNDCLELRLVSSAFYWAVTRVLYEHDFVTVWPIDKDRVSLLKRYLNPPVIRHFRIQLDRGEVRTSQRTYMSADDLGSQGNQGSLTPFQDFMEILPEALDALPGLKSFEVRLTKAWYLGGPRKSTLTAAMLEALTECFISHFTPAQSLPHLTHLRLLLPYSFEFSLLGRAFSDEKLRRLNHLSLEYVDPLFDYSWPEGRPYPQDRVPNMGYAAQVWSLIRRCQNLDSLEMIGFPPLHDYDLEWNPSDGGLTSLVLKRLILSKKSLLALLSPTSVKVTSLKKIEVLGMSWAKILQHLIECSSLRYTELFQESTRLELCCRSPSPFRVMYRARSNAGLHVKMKELAQVLIIRNGGDPAKDLHVYLNSNRDLTW